jgi:integrase
MLLRDYTDAYIDLYGEGGKRWTPRVAKNIDWALGRMAAEFGDADLENLPPMRAWAVGESATTVKHCRAALNDALRDRVTDHNPLAAIRKGEGRGRSDIEPLSEDELEVAIDIARNKFSGEVHRAIRFAGYTGVRQGELLGLEVQDLEGATCWIRRSLADGEVKLPKNGLERRIVLPPRTFAPGSPYDPLGLRLFPGMTPDLLRSVWSVVRAELGREDLKFHDLRHTAATIFLERGASPEDVAIQLGHQDGGSLVRTRYGHPSIEGALSRLAGVWT